MKIKTFLLSALALTAVGFAAPKTAKASAETRDFFCQYSAREKDSEYMAYGSTEVITYTADEAATAGIPAGYENEVLEVVQTGDSNTAGIFLDFEQEQVPVSLIDSLQFRIYIVPHASNTGNRPQARITDPTMVGTGWIHQPGDIPTPAGEWTTVTVPYADNFSHIAKDDMLDKFEFCVRMNAYSPFYIDSIQYVLKADDGAAPVISYAGADTVAIALGGALPLNVSAYDDQEQRNVAVEYVWADGVALNDNGTPDAVGSYTLTLKAADFYGNMVEKVITVNVVDSDNEAPVIDLAYDTVKTTVGTKPMLDVTATDNSGSATLTTTWSKGALDGRGRLTEGTHTWTITAKDAFGNSTKKTITFIVTVDEPQYSLVTNEENLTRKHTVTFDGENAVTLSHGFKVDKPADPVKESTEAATYTFIGWYNGEAEWDFNSEVTEDMDLTSKWQETKRLYRVYFDGKASTTKLCYGDLIPASAVPAEPRKDADEKYNYVFAGWYNGDVLWNFETDTIAGEVKLTSRFEKVDRIYTVTFDGKDAQEVKYGEKLIEPATPEKEGFVFDGWYSGVTKWDFAKHTVRSNMDLTAKWIAIGGDSTTEDSVEDSVDQNSASDTLQSGQMNILMGCMGSIGGLTGGLMAMATAFVALLKKKEE